MYLETSRRVSPPIATKVVAILVMVVCKDRSSPRVQYRATKFSSRDLCTGVHTLRAPSPTSFRAIVLLNKAPASSYIYVLVV